MSSNIREFTKEIQEEKHKLEVEIGKLVVDFTEKTGMIIQDIRPPQYERIAEFRPGQKEDWVPLTGIAKVTLEIL